jgi:hypothetical protein
MKSKKITTAFAVTFAVAATVFNAYQDERVRQANLAKFCADPYTVDGKRKLACISTSQVDTWRSAPQG